MTLGEYKQVVYSVIEEYNENEEDLTEDEDLAAKMNSCIDIMLSEMSRFKKIDAYKTLEVNKGDNLTLKDIADDVYQLNLIRGVDYQAIQNRVIFNETGTAEIYYYKYPEPVKKDTRDEIYTFELDDDALKVMAYGVAGLLKAEDIASNYGRVYTDLYREKLSQLDPRKTMPTVSFVGGVDI